MTFGYVEMVVTRDKFFTLIDDLHGETSFGLSEWMDGVPVQVRCDGLKKDNVRVLVPKRLVKKVKESIDDASFARRYR